MYMITRGSSMVPLIKLSEGYSYGLKNNYVTIVCGSNGEKLKPVKLWNPTFDFFNKEKLNAEFISKSELVYIKVFENQETINIDVTLYRLPDYMIDNTELEYEVIRKTRPITTNIFQAEIRADSSQDCLDSFLSVIGNGVFKTAVIQAINKLKSKDSLCYVL